MKVLLVGNGYMASEYAKILQRHHISFSVAGRNLANVSQFAEKNIASSCFLLSDLADREPKDFSHAIVAVSVENLFAATKALIECGVKKILVEKPVALDSSQVEEIGRLAEAAGADLRVALNRRFYQSVQYLKSLSEKEKFQSCFFDFTEWGWQIGDSAYPAHVKERWGLANSIHVIDTAIYLANATGIAASRVEGKGSLAWHPVGSIFSGMLRADIPTAYMSNWNAPGRWAIEITTVKGRYRLAPMEKLQVMRHKTVEFVPVEGIDFSIDTEFKPGLCQLVRKFLGEETATDTQLPGIASALRSVKLAEKILGYSDV